jgi:hypothetical protein
MSLPFIQIATHIHIHINIHIHIHIVQQSREQLSHSFLVFSPLSLSLFPTDKLREGWLIRM